MNNLSVGKVVIMKKPHACGKNEWTIVRYGADVKIKCNFCGRLVMIERPKFQKNVKKTIE